jgi:hypothetical protein
MVVTNSGGRVDEVVRRVDAELKACFHEDPNGDLRPWACTSCDGFVKKDKKRAITLKRLKEEKELFKPQRELPTEAKSHHGRSGEGKEAFMKDLLLSPAGCRAKESKGFCICSSCNVSAQKQETPLRATANGFEIGPCAKELECWDCVTHGTSCHPHGGRAAWRERGDAVWSQRQQRWEQGVCILCVNLHDEAHFFLTI